MQKQPSMFYWKAAALKIQYLGKNNFQFSVYFSESVHF